MEIGEHWRTIIDAVQEGIIIVDNKGFFVAANQSAQLMTGYTEEELKGKSCRVLNCTGCRIKAAGSGKNWCELFVRGLIREKKCLITNIHNRAIPIVKSANVMYDDSGNAVGAVETLRDITENINCRNELVSIKRMFHLDDGFHGIIGKAPPMQNLYGLIESVGPSDTPVMILGESGTGKEMVAKALHESSPRASQPFIKVNCAALSENLLESELFGHVKGAYTGADQKRIGRFEAAHNGTIFLDEVGDIPMSVQVKLLRVLEDKKIERVGENRSVPVNVRIITATNRDLEELIKQGSFREDLYFRINVFPVNCPPLRDRKEDIPVIAQHFLNLNVEKTGKSILGFTPDTMQIMVNYPWPGNVRELRNTVEYAVVLATGSSISPDHLPGRLMGARFGDTENQNQNRGRDSQPLQNEVETEKDQLLQVLRQTGGNQSKAAGMLGVSRVTVWKRIKKHGIDLSADI